MTRAQISIRRSHVDGIELVEADTARSFTRHTHDQFGIGIILRGAQRSASGRGQVEAGAGDIITVNPGEVHDGSAIDVSGRRWAMLYLEPHIVLDIVADITGDVRDPEFQYPVVVDRTAMSRFASLWHALMTERASEAISVESRLYPLVASLIEERRRVADDDAPIHRARMMIDDAPQFGFTLDQLASCAGVGKFQLLRSFARQTGFTPHAYIMQKRTDLARRLIRGGMALADAAATSGFSDQSHMTRLFVSKYGITPGVYAAAFA